MMRIGAAVLAAGLAGWAGAQTEPDQKTVADLLGGPHVREVAKPAEGLAELMGGIQGRPEAPPEELALALLELDDETAAAAEAVLADRAKAVDAVVREHRALILKLMNLGRPGDAEDPQAAREQRGELMREIRAALEPVVEAGLLADRLAAVLPAAQAERYRALLADYREQAGAMQGRMTPAGGGGFLEGRPGMTDEQRARWRDRMARMADDPRFARRQAVQAEYRQIVAIEVPRSLRGMVEQRRSGLDALIADLDLDVETEAAVRRILMEAAAATQAGERTDRRAVLRELAELLTPEQRRALRRGVGF